MDNNNTIKLTKQQLLSVEMVKNNQVSILTGGPGTGKTTTTKEIIDWAISENLKISQAAPTGKAAKRMMSATDYYASTIHTMLGCEFDDKTKSFKFIRNAYNNLPADLIILDEISMITNDLMARVLEAIDTNKTKLLLIGDQNQLPSVGAGAILRDILASKTIPHVELDIIHRNSGKIVTACHKIKDGQLYTPVRKLNLEADSPVNLIHIECFTPESALLGIEKLMCDVIPKKYNYDPVEDIQVISPVNKKGELSCDSINKVLRNRLNPDKVNNFEENLDNHIDNHFKAKENNSDNNTYKFRSGDKVINTKNSKAESVGGEESAIVNGDIGIVQAVDVKSITVLFSDPERTVRIPKSDQHLLHAYCITCHRFQGSEAPVIIIPVHRQFNYFLSNSWIYTAISRAKDICITIGSFQTVERAIRNRQPNNRVTMLSEKLIAADRANIEREFEGI